MFNPYTQCVACGGNIREKHDDIALSHTSEPRPIMFFHDTEECRQIAQAMRLARGKNEWCLTFRAYRWCPQEAEGLAS